MSRGDDHDDDLILVWIAYFLIVKVIFYLILQFILKTILEILSICINDLKLKYSLTKIMHIFQLNCNMCNIFLFKSEKTGNAQIFFLI